MPKIAVYLKSEVPFESPASHSSSLTFCALVLADGSARFVCLGAQKKALQLTTGETWRQLKDRIKPRAVRGKLIPSLKAHTKPINLDLSYPEKNRESARHPHEAFKRECLAAKKRKALAQAPIQA